MRSKTVNLYLSNSNKVYIREAKSLEDIYLILDTVKPSRVAVLTPKLAWIRALEAYASRIDQKPEGEENEGQVKSML